MVVVQKWQVFQLFFLGNIGQKNDFYDNSRTKKRLSRLKRQEVQTVQK